MAVLVVVQEKKRNNVVAAAMDKNLATQRTLWRLPYFTHPLFSFRFSTLPSGVTTFFPFPPPSPSSAALIDVSLGVRSREATTPFGARPRALSLLT